MANTYILIASSIVGAGGAATINFSSIPNTYTDFLIKLCARSSRSDVYDNFNIKLNGSTSGYSTKFLFGNGSSPSSASTAGASVIDYGLIPAATATASTFGSAEIYLPNYAGSAYKSLSIDEVTENNATAAYAAIEAALWSSTGAVNQITFSTVYGNFVQYSTAYLYGIKNS